MNCPNCGRENPDDARFCNSCGRAFTAAEPAKERVEVRISKAAVESFICSLIALLCFVPGLIAIVHAGVLNPSSELVNDNIFTRWHQDDRIRGTEPGHSIEPAAPTDSLLVNDPVPSR